MFEKYFATAFVSFLSEILFHRKCIVLLKFPSFANGIFFTAHEGIVLILYEIFTFLRYLISTFQISDEIVSCIEKFFEKNVYFMFPLQN